MSLTGDTYQDKLCVVLSCCEFYSGLLLITGEYKRVESAMWELFFVTNENGALEDCDKFKIVLPNSKGKVLTVEERGPSFSCMDNVGIVDW